MFDAVAAGPGFLLEGLDEAELELDRENWSADGRDRGEGGEGAACFETMAVDVLWRAVLVEEEAVCAQVVELGEAFFQEGSLVLLRLSGGSHWIGSWRLLNGVRGLVLERRSHFP